MITSPFTPVTNCPLSSTVVTSTITVSTAGTNGSSLSLPSGSFAVVNGTHITAFPVTVTNGETLAIGTTSSNLNDTATFVIATFGGAQFVVTFVTIPPNTSELDPQMIDVPFYQRTNPNGTPYTSTVHNYAISVSGTITEKSCTATPTLTNTTLYQLMILDPYNQQAHIVGSDGVLVQTFDLPDACWTGATVYNTGRFSYWFGLIDQNQIAITLNGLDFTYLPLAGSPVAVTSNFQGTYAWVATYNKILYCYQPTGVLTFAASAQINLPAIPSSIAMDSEGNCYVVAMTTNTLTKYSPTGTQLGSVVVGNMPMSVVSIGDTLYVSCAEDQTIIQVNGDSMTVTTTLAFPEFPSMLSIDPTDNNLCVACLTSPNVYRYTTGGSLTLVDKTVFALPVLTAYSFGNNIIADYLQSDARPYVISLNSVVPGLGFYSSNEAPINTTIVSTTVTATLLQINVPISIPANLNATIVLNGQNIGTSGTISDNESFYIQSLTPSTGQTVMQIPVAVGNYVEAFQYTTSAIQTQPFSFYWSPTTVPNAGTAVQSPVQTIKGLTIGTSVTVSANMGTLYHNGTAVTGTFSVVNGDTIQLVVTSGATYIAPKITVGSLIVTWFVYTSAKASNIFDQSVTGLALNTAQSSTPYSYPGSVAGKLAWNASAGFTVKVNGTTVTSPATLPVGAQIVLTGTSSSQLGDKNTFVATDGTDTYELDLRTIDRLAPYPADFGVLYGVLPGVYYESLDVTIGSLTTLSETLQIDFSGSFYISDVDSTLESVNVSNGSVVGLNIRAQVGPTTMYTLPVYYLDANSNQQQFGSVRLIPVVLQGATNGVYTTHEGSDDFDYISEVQTSGYESTYDYTTLPDWQGIVETSYEYTTVADWQGITETSYSYQTLDGNRTGNYESSYQYGTVASWMGVSETSYTYSTIADWAGVVETGYTYGTKALWEGIVETGLTYTSQYVVPSTNEVPMLYGAIGDTPFAITWLSQAFFSSAIYYGETDVQPVWELDTIDGSNLYNQMTTVDNTVHTIGEWMPTPVPVISSTLGFFQFTPGMYLTGMWFGSMLVPQTIQLGAPGRGQLPSTVPGWGTYGFGPMPGQTPYIQIVPESTQIILGAEDAQYSENQNTTGTFGFEEAINGTTKWTLDPMTATLYEEVVSDSLPEPALYGAFATQQDAAAFITTNSLTNGYTVQLSNGYWIVLSTVSETDVVCAVDTSGAIYPIAWLLGGG